MARVITLHWKIGYSEGQDDENLLEPGIDDIQPNAQESILYVMGAGECRIPLPTTTTITMEESHHSPINTTTVPE